MDFKPFKHEIAKKFSEMSKSPNLFVTDVTIDEMWETYLGSFPPGTDNLFRERTEHDCCACKHFIRNVGNVVAILPDGTLDTIWNIKCEEEGYQAVANALHDLVSSRKISHIFLSHSSTAGVDKNRELIGDDVIQWEHFFVNIPKKFVVKESVIADKIARFKTNRDMLERLVRECCDSNSRSIRILIEIIEQGSLYRGDEYIYPLRIIEEVMKGFHNTPETNLDTFFILESLRIPEICSRLRNTSIGTIIIDLNNGVDLEEAVRKYESIVAPQNYKRPVALVTERMVNDTKKSLSDLGLLSALDRRFATMDDIPITNSIFVNRDIKTTATKDIFDSIHTENKKSMSKIESIPIKDFISNVIPSATSIEILFENNHIGNLMSLIAPSDPTSGQLFKWDNNISWSYRGGVADSIKERVKKAGGVTDAELCCRLSWSNYDDLDLSIIEPGGHKIYFGYKYGSNNIGKLDVDMNVHPDTRNPVENIYYSRISSMRNGEYHLRVNQFKKRENIDVGFDIEIEILGEVYNFSYPKAVRQDETIDIATITVKNGEASVEMKDTQKSYVSKEVWGVKTGQYIPVSLITESPNYWGSNNVGNKHYFFIMSGCQNDEKTRGFYNEFLNNSIDKHRKVMEHVGANVDVPFSENQLSGVGFSTTKRNSIMAKVTGNFARIVKVTF